MIYLLTLRRLRNCQGFDFSDLQCRQKQFVEIVLAFQCRGVFSSAVGAALDFGIKFFPCHGKIHFVDCIAPVAADGTEGADRVWIGSGPQICFFCQAIRKIPEHFFAPGSPDLFCCVALLCNSVVQLFRSYATTTSFASAASTASFFSFPTNTSTFSSVCAPSTDTFTASPSLTAFTVNTVFPWISGTFVSAASFN